MDETIEKYDTFVNVWPGNGGTIAVEEIRDDGRVWVRHQNGTRTSIPFTTLTNPDFWVRINRR
jgi:hypothetical protein